MMPQKYSKFLHYRFGTIHQLLTTVFLMAVISGSISFVIAGTTAPTTVHNLVGTLGQDSWYRSDIDVTLTGTDLESGMLRTTYWVDSDPPTVTNFSTSPVDQFSNRSFESGFFTSINDWYAGLSGLALYYRSSIAAYDGNRSAAIAFIDFGGGDYYHWHNEPHAVEYPPGETASISARARMVVFPGDISYMEVWGQDVNGNNDQLLATSNQLQDFSWSWREATAQFTVPTDGTNYIYVKVGSEGSPAAIIYWDFVEGSNILTQGVTNFTFTDEGNHTLHYFSEDNNSNVETEVTTPLKKDTVNPNPWQTFIATQQGCNHCYVTSAEVRDTTSGVDVSTAEYRFYTDHQMWYWSGWSAVDTVTRAPSGPAVSDGETDFVKLTTPEIDFGDSASWPLRVQFRIADMAGNLSTSPVYELTAPWIQANDGSIFIGGEISIPTASSGADHGNADVMTDDDIASFTTSTNWTDDDYQNLYFGATQIEDLLSEYARIKASAVALPSGDLPVVDGIYISNSDYTIQNSTLPNNYDSADVSAVVIIEGNLDIDAGFTVDEANNTVFLVEGDILVKQNVNEFAGFYIAEGQFDSDVSGNSQQELVVDGSVLALLGYSLPRDLGDSGPVNNSNTAAETFNWQPDMLVDLVLAEYLTQEEQRYVWQEVAQP